MEDAIRDSSLSEINCSKLNSKREWTEPVREYFLLCLAGIVQVGSDPGIPAIKQPGEPMN
jgi:hypothetical protein